ncbi:MAG: TlyA family RNA methyltransferase [Acholeplasmataceae bacterium]|jgi:23S rRNA (cytidine1920-2'-O)/16S rRNA (cytidine1409-2'-O)-methyltransferase
MRLDNYLKIKYDDYTRSQLQDFIKRGLVTVNEKIVTKTGYQVKNNDHVVLNEVSKYASRAAFKLEDIYHRLGLNFRNKVILDVGSSTGGFTDFSLKHGAKLVYAYDVGTNQMIDRLRNDERVILNEQTNILEVMPPKVDLVLIDVSFTSSKPILDHLKNVSNHFLILIKPQFEVGAEYLSKGIVKNKKRVNALLDEYIEFAQSLTFNIVNLLESCLPGKEGNIEYWIYLTK